jgi:hypothetical protein
MRVAEARAVLTKLRDVAKETVRQLTRLDKQQTAERVRLYETLGKLADGVYDALPEEPETPDPSWERDFERASALRDEVENLAGNVDEISLHVDTEVLANVLGEIAGFYDGLKETEAQLSKVERVGAKLGI